MTEQYKTVLRGAACLILTATTALALPGTPWKRAELFATCSGRLAALETRQVADADPAQTKTAQSREVFDLMLEATLPEAQRFGVPAGEDVRWRSAGWSEVAVLLADMDYSFDSLRAAQARAALEDRISDCTALILTSAD